MNHYAPLRLITTLTLTILFLSACSTPTAIPPTATPASIPHTATPEINTEAINGEISDYSLLGQMGLNFTGTFEGISFKLIQQPEKTFNLHIQSFDEAIELGIMSKDPQGWIQFENIVGWKVEIVYEKNEEEGGGYKVISFTGEAPPPTSADSGVFPTDSSTVHPYTISETPTLSTEYIVHPRDTCASIALTFNIPQESLIELNNLSADCSDLSVGQKLIIPTPVP